MPCPKGPFGMGHRLVFCCGTGMPRILDGRLSKRKHHQGCARHLRILCTATLEPQCGRRAAARLQVAVAVSNSHHVRFTTAGGGPAGGGRRRRRRRPHEAKQPRRTCLLCLAGGRHSSVTGKDGGLVCNATAYTRSAVVPPAASGGTARDANMHLSDG